MRLKPLRLRTGCLVLAAALASGCKPKSSAPPHAGYFQTPFQSECEFIVQAIVSDLAEQMYYAAKHRLPDEKSSSVIASEKPGSPRDEPVYALEIRLDPKQPEIKCDVAITGPIWSPQVYQGVAKQMAQAVALTPGIQREAKIMRYWPN